MRIRKSEIEAVTPYRPSDYLQQIASITIEEDEEFVYVDVNGYHKLRTLYNTNDISVGTELKKLISWFPVPKKNCRSCRSLEKKMNRWGPDICLQKIDYICKKLHIAAKRRNMPFSRTIAISMVNKAIQNATLVKQRVVQNAR